MHTPVSDLYRIFKPYRLGDDFSIGNCGVRPSDCEALASMSLDQLTVEDLNRYVFKAMSTWGGVRHFKYFLPRLLELALDDFDAFHEPEILLGKLAYAGWTEWPEVEQAAIRRYLATFWQRQLHNPCRFPHSSEINTTLGGLAYACASLMPFLATWGDSGDELPALHLAQLIVDEADYIMTGRAVLLWGEPAIACAELATWLAGDEVLEILTPHRAVINELFRFAFAQLDGIRAAAAT